MTRLKSPTNLSTSLIIMFALCSLLPIVVGGQSEQAYYIKGIVVNGLQLKAMLLTLTDTAGKTIITQHSDSLGSFTFKGLTSGKYHLINKDYKLDTLFAIKGRSIDLFDIQLNICDVNAIQAAWDIQHGKIRLLLAGGISPVYYHGQEAFENKYHLQYYEYGCTPPEQACMVAYNRIIFKYLDKQYGKRWRREVRKDVIGYK